MRRIRSYLACGFDVQGFTMRRDNMNPDFEPFWPNLHLYNVQNERPLDRIWVIAKSIVKVARHRHLLKDTDVIVARSLDMLSIGAVACWLAPGRPRLIYECLDIHDMMVGNGLKNRIFRWAERRLLDRSDALIVSAPAFIENYFEPMQNWQGETTLIENKLWVDDPAGLPRPLPASVQQRAEISEEAPLICGWVGTLRCAQSLALLSAAAAALGPRIRIVMHGVVHAHALPDFDEVVARHDNMHFEGPYEYPGGLEAIYRDCDVVWSQDLWQFGTNSTWLLPNRIYEASYFGCPSIAVDGTDTGARVMQGIGWTISRPDADELIDLLRRLEASELTEKRREILSRPDAEFRQSHDEILAALEPTDQWQRRAAS
ncbi:glycosyltransferase [Sulfitobacter aestuarii]|uniref:Glycosyltransferase n=1 Tax=Sulfitobacter aestuarii TaxID=2161676 RepID=A0ABW5U271_9RHOB